MTTTEQDHSRRATDFADLTNTRTGRAVTTQPPSHVPSGVLADVLTRVDADDVRHAARLEASPAGGARPPGRVRLLVLGANGPTGRRVVEQALARGHHVRALTRHPETFHLQHDRLQVITGDATDEKVIDAAVAETDAVICTIGAAFTRQPVDVYSTSARLLVASMNRHRTRRLLVVTSGGVDTTHQPHSVAARLSRSLMRDHIGKTVYDDMEKMEQTVSSSDLDWTIVRPPGLTDEPGDGYATAETSIDGPVMSRDDLARMLLDQLDDTHFVRKVAAVTSPGLKVSALHMLRREVLKR